MDLPEEEEEEEGEGEEMEDPSLPEVCDILVGRPFKRGVLCVLLCVL